MHLITSNFNLIETNSAWLKLKKKDVKIDTDFDNFFLNLSNKKTLQQFNSFHTLIYLTDTNYKNILKKINNLAKVISAHNSKPFFFYFFSKKKTKITLKKINFKLKKFKLKKNFFLEYFLNSHNNLFNNRNLLFIKFPFDIETIFLFTKIIKSKIKLINNKPYKLIILDCDNTLWGGVLDEDKPSEIQYSSKNKNKVFAFKDFQKKIKNLKNKGFLLSICSKNNESRVWNFFKKRKMELQKKDFILSKINWNEKFDNINFIVKSLNLRFEDCIFIDDNILEIKKVKEKIKNINTMHLKDISYAIKLINNDIRFNRLIVSEDDKKKYKQYKLKSKFTQYVRSEKIAPNLIKGLNQKIKILKCKTSNLKRAEELFNKTNQFNFSLNRHSSKDIINILNNKNHELKLFSLKDKFGDHGIIGAYVLEKKKYNILISDFVLSCRVLYRYVEQYMLFHIIKNYPTKKVEIIYKKTNVNSNLIPNFLKSQYFKLSHKSKSCLFYNIKFNKESINETKKIF